MCAAMSVVPDYHIRDGLYEGVCQRRGLFGLYNYRPSESATMAHRAYLLSQSTFSPTRRSPVLNSPTAQSTAMLYGLSSHPHSPHSFRLSGHHNHDNPSLWIRPSFNGETRQRNRGASPFHGLRTKVKAPYVILGQQGYKGYPASPAAPQFH